jgi:nitrogen fixation NifU-like protein
MAKDERWLEHFRNPRHVGDLPDATHTGRAGVPGRGNYMVVRLRVTEGTIGDARFTTFGCPAAIACGSALMDTIVGMHVAAAQRLGEPDLLAALGDLPLGKRHIPALALRALRDALGV